MNYKIQEANGNFTVKIEKSIDKPWYKFWGPNTAWVTLLRKDGSKCTYTTMAAAKATIKLKGGTLCE